MGENTSVLQAEQDSGTSARTAGCTTAPWRSPPRTRRAPASTASAIQACARVAAASLIMGPTRVATARGSPAGMSSR
ncbi:Uncharacterised protein [Bordetella pertussis]|nr:Uncharacterised protein [Bordetella pertussis]